MKTTLGILAHVDAGKTTLSENLLLHCGAIRSAGRVDHGDTHLDTDAMERSRGITIFTKPVQLSWQDHSFFLLDTPGHVDFAAEAERTLSVLDYAVLLISAADGVQSHTKTLWRLLKNYRIPTFIFVNKTDLAVRSQADLLAELKSQLDDACFDFSAGTFTDEEMENLATCSEKMLDAFMENGTLSDTEISEAVSCRALFPVFFGSALRDQGTDRLLEGLCRYTVEGKYSDEFSASAFKLERDSQDHRKVWIKMKGGSLHIRDAMGEDKVSRLFLLSGDKELPVDQLSAGDVGCVYGLDSVRPGEGLGSGGHSPLPLLEPVLSYRILTPDGIRIEKALADLKELEEEDPALSVVWQEDTRELTVRLMGPVQLEILQQQVKTRFGYLITFGQGKILYKETIAGAVEGVGHFEPLRHYAEAHILMEPLERGAGFQYELDCPTDLLSLNWQRLILTHLKEKVHKGVLTGSPLCDVKFTVIAGKAHTKHTEGGDFRQATYRAVRQGLMKAESILLEPYVTFELRVPMDKAGKALTDLQQKNARIEAPELEGETSIIRGRASVAALGNYAADLAAYTSGFGQLICTNDGYDVCTNAADVIAAKGYDPTLDRFNTPDSVFCQGGAGYIVPWYEVEGKMHVPSPLEEKISEEENLAILAAAKREAYERAHAGRPEEGSYIFEEELKDIFAKNFGTSVKPRDFSQPQVRDYTKQREAREAYLASHGGEKKKPTGKKYFLVDGYNIIHAWPNLAGLAAENLDAARLSLLDTMDNFHGFLGGEMIVVFDAYKVKGNHGSAETYGTLHVVYTKEAETADAYIERTCHELAAHANVTVATSDGLEQTIILGEGAHRMSARELLEEVRRVDSRV